MKLCNGSLHKYIISGQTKNGESTADFGALDGALVQKEVSRHKTEILQGEMAEELGTTGRVLQKKRILYEGQLKK